MVGEDVLKETLARLDLTQGLKEKAQDAPHSKTLGLGPQTVAGGVENTIDCVLFKQNKTRRVKPPA